MGGPRYTHLSPIKALALFCKAYNKSHGNWPPWAGAKVFTNAAEELSKQEISLPRHAYVFMI